MANLKSCLVAGREVSRIQRRTAMVNSELERDASMILAIPRNFVFHPVAFLGKGWTVLEDETDERATLTEIDFAKVKFTKDSWITGREKLEQLRASGGIRWDVGVFLALWNEKEHNTLRWLYERRGIVRLNFMGTIFRHPLDGHLGNCESTIDCYPDGIPDSNEDRFVLCLYIPDILEGWWDWCCRWLDDYC